MILKDYRNKYMLTNVELAYRFKCSPSSVGKWIKSEGTPSRRMQRIIHRKTKGEVTYEDWNDLYNINDGISTSTLSQS